jgi:thymidylate synthase (FAD)
MQLLSVTPDYMNLLCTAAGQCHGKLTAPKSAIETIIQSGHLSVLEHATATFYIKCSRKVLAQFTRHRHFSFTVQSSRVCRLTNMYQGLTTEVDKVLESMFQAYDKALADGISCEEASYLLPEGAVCSLVVTGNFRTWLEFLPKRLCKRALPEFRQIASQIHEELAKAVPEVFDRQLMNCTKCTERSCNFS